MVRPMARGAAVSDCTSSGDGWQIGGGRCAGSMSVADCVHQVSAQCSSNHDCHAKLTNLELSQEALETHEVQQTAARQADAEHELHDQ